jgi:hypothetical protein
MIMQIFANFFAAIFLVSVLVQFVMLCRSLVKGEATVLPADWPPRRQRSFYRTRFALCIIGPVSWLTWVLMLVELHPGWSRGMLDTNGAVFLGLLAGQIEFWLRAVTPGDYATLNNPPAIKWPLATSAVAMILGVAYAGLLLASHLAASSA